MELAVFTAQQDQTEFTFKVEEAHQELQFVRTGPASVVLLGLKLGLPEIISSEIAHPVRDRVRGADNAFIADAALWAQHGRGPIQESVTLISGQTLDTLGLVIETRFRYYVADRGPIEILSQDRCTYVVRKCIPGCTYVVSSPEQQIVQDQANKYFLYEPGLLLATDRNRRLDTIGKQGIILPNREDIIDDVIFTFRNATGEKTDKKLTVRELMSVQADSNANIAELQVNSTVASLRDSLFMQSDTADLMLLMFNDVDSVLIENRLGTELRYTVVSSVDRP